MRKEVRLMIDGLGVVVPLLGFAGLGMTLSVLALRQVWARPSAHRRSRSAAGRPALPSIDIKQPSEIAQATFAMGCFWEAEARFGAMSGVVRTRVGYAGGGAGTPSYTQLGEHSEVVQVEFDPTVVSYQQLLDVFWNGHDPSYRHWSRRYASIVFYHDAHQRERAETGKEQLASRRPGRVLTEIRPFVELHLAEPSHHKYHVRQVPELEEAYRATYPQFGDWIGSTALARVNCYLAGHGRLGALRRELKALGLSAVNQSRLLTYWRPTVGTVGTGICNFEDLSKSPIEP
jgi:methionine-S-sulfoxide reductase